MIKSPMFACSTQPDITKLSYPLYASFKMDGIRCVTPEGKVLSRTLKPIPNRYIQKMLGQLPYALDGELMVDGNFNEVDSAVMSFEGKPKFKFMVFDVINIHENFIARQTILKRLCDSLILTVPEIYLVPQHVCYSAKDVQEYYDKAIEAGYEGLILRSGNGLYKQGRSTLKQEWMLKLKPINDTEATVYGKTELLHNENMPEINNIGGTERNKQQAGMVGGETLGALLGLDKNGRPVKVGSGFTAAQRQEIWNNFDKYKGKQFTFKYQDLTPDGAYRFPVFKGWRNDV